MKKYIVYFLLLGFTLVVSESSACDLANCTIDECGDPQNGFCYDPEDANIPIDGGISLLIAGGAALGLGGLFKSRRKKANA